MLMSQGQPWLKFLHKVKLWGGPSFQTRLLNFHHCLLSGATWSGKGGIGFMGRILERKCCNFFRRKRCSYSGGRDERWCGTQRHTVPFSSLSIPADMRFHLREAGWGWGTRKEKQFPIFFTDDPWQLCKGGKRDGGMRQEGGNRGVFQWQSKENGKLSMVSRNPWRHPRPCPAKYSAALCIPTSEMSAWISGGTVYWCVWFSVVCLRVGWSPGANLLYSSAA